MNETLTADQSEKLTAWLTENGYGSVEEWAEDSDYTLTDDGWVDENGNPHGDIEVTAWHAMEAAATAEPVQYSLFTVKGSALPALLESAKGSVYVETGEDYPAVKCDGPAFRELLWAAVDPDEPDTVDVSLPADGRFYRLDQDVQVMVPQSPTVRDTPTKPTLPEHIADLARHIAGQAEAIAEGKPHSFSGAVSLLADNVDTLTAWVRLLQAEPAPRKVTANDVTPDQLAMLARGNPPRTTTE